MMSFLSRRCANCGTELPASARFCFTCGQPVGASTPAENTRLTRLAANTPASLAAKIRSQAARLAGERKIVTSLFADVVGSTALAERMDAEDWTTIMNQAIDRLAPAVYRYEGTIARLMGDALLAFFGAPVAHEDDPVRAVRAALDMLEAARKYSEQVRGEYRIEFAIRVGLNTGPVVVGNVGSDLVYEYTAMGDAVNLAARMQTAARPMTVLIAEDTYRFVRPVFDCIEIGPIQVKGKSEPVRAYEVRGVKAQPGRLRGLAGLESPLVGRSSELATLVQLTRAFPSGAGQAVVLTGEPGLGKTRLIAEWRGQAQPDLQWYEGHCLSYGQGLAYHLIMDILRSLLGIAIGAGEPETRQALMQRANEWFGEGASGIYPFLGHLLSVGLDEAALERVKVLDPQALQAQYLAALEKTFLAIARRSLLVLVFEDIHWADPSSIELLIKLLPLTAQAPLLFCFTSRPEPNSHGWKLVSAVREPSGINRTELALSPLSENDSQQLVSNLLEVEALPERVRKLILQKAEGNPFFVEEMIRMLVDRGTIFQRDGQWVAGKEIEGLEIPDNLQGLLLARIDRLPEEIKRTLRVASVIGRQFSVRVLEEVLGE